MSFYLPVWLIPAVLYVALVLWVIAEGRRKPDRPRPYNWERDGL